MAKVSQLKRTDRCLPGVRLFSIFDEDDDIIPFTGIIIGKWHAEVMRKVDTKPNRISRISTEAANVDLAAKSIIPMTSNGSLAQG